MGSVRRISLVSVDVVGRHKRTKVRSHPGPHSRPPSISSSTRGRRRTSSKSKPKPRKSEESQELSRDRVPNASLDLQRGDREPPSEENDVSVPKTPTRSTATVVSLSQPLVQLYHSCLLLNYNLLHLRVRRRRKKACPKTVQCLYD